VPSYQYDEGTIEPQMPPPAEGFAARFVVGPALRTQPDRRLVTLVRQGYENAFEEIVRRYGKTLTRYATAIVGGRAEDVTQDAFSKALLALRRDGREIELRPWLFRIVRNTALNELRDHPPSAEVLAESIAGGGSPAEELERREELADLMRRLRSLPDAQRAAIVMRELEGLSHEEIAAALGLSGGAARQAIFRARRALRDAAGVLLPLPLLKALLAGGANAPVEAAAGAAGLGGAAGTGVAIKAATATVLVAGAVGAGVAIDHGRHPGPPPKPARASGILADDPAGAGRAVAADEPGAASRGSSGHGRDRDSEPGDDRGEHSGEDRHGGHGEEHNDLEDAAEDRGGRSGPSGAVDGGDDGDDRRSGRGSGGPSGSGSDGSSSGPGSGSSSRSDGSVEDRSGSGSDSDSTSSVSSGPGSGDLPAGSEESGSSGSGSGDDGLVDSSGSGDSGDSGGGDGFSLQTEPQG
jgi:RNA polymerase sigma factor (sigma-70 family)